MANPKRTIDLGPFHRIGLYVVSLTLPLGVACSSPLGGRDVDIELSARAFPGAGMGVALAQRMLEHESSRYDLELGLEEQRLEEEGPRGDEWSRLWCGVRWRPRDQEEAFFLHGGATWLRTNGLASGLDNPGDYGGVYLGGGYLWTLTPALGTGPDLTLLWVDSEGNSSGSGVLGQLAWRIVWRL